MNILKFFSNHILFIFALFFLAFIPLYPKLPLLDIEHTWVYVRIEDFLVALAGIVFLVQLIRKKATLKTPLTVSILIFFAVGLISTIHAILFIFPQLANVFPDVAILHFLRRVEYLSLFFIGYAAMKQKSFTHAIAAVLLITLILVVLYGLGQKGVFVGWENRFPAFSTMNEEFAKGIPLQISALGRISSTFAGHYDLAAFLVMMIPIMGSFVFGFKKLYVKFLFFLAGVGGLALLLLTNSRVSFAVYLAAVVFMILLQKVRFLYKAAIIVFVVIGSVLMMNASEGISDRFGSTISQVDVVVDARTGKPVGVAQTQSDETGKKIVIEDKTPTGEDLPQGSGYINIPGGDEGDSVSEVTYKRTEIQADGEVTEVTELEGDFVIKKVLAYDLSFTTRFQGTWPRAFEAFQRNYFLGSGYSSISLATDNNYLRILGEVGLLGFFAYLGIFLFFGIYVRRMLPNVDDKPARAFIVGVTAAVFGVGLNAILIDVFEASKVAFVMWLLVGLAVGLLHLYQKERINYLKEMRKVFTSIPAIAVYLLITVIAVYGSTVTHFFIGDDFTWLRWAAECEEILVDGQMRCESSEAAISGYFTDSEGFFFRPGTKTYFYLMYPFFSLSQYAYHVVSLSLHFVISVLVLLISSKILRSRLFGTVTAFSFALLSAHSEAVLWVSATGHLVTYASLLLALLAFIYWRETKHILFFFATIPFLIIAPLFHEVGIVGPVLLVGYDLIINFNSIKKAVLSRWFYILYLLLIPGYLYIRSNAGSHFMEGDYSYNLIKLPFNAIGNLFGYVILTFGGTQSYPFYESLRTFGREHTSTVWTISLVALFAFVVLYWLKLKYISGQTKSTLLLIALLFVVPLSPFLGLGNISYRYDYFASFALLLFASFVLMNLYTYMLPRIGKIVALILIMIPILSFNVWQIVELERIKDDWRRAGEQTEEILITFNEVYAITRGFAPNPVFYFVNTPIRTGEAWVFPVGLDDALWFTFQNENLTVREVPTLDMAFDVSEGSTSAKVFEFDNQGNIHEVIKAVPNEENAE